MLYGLESARSVRETTTVDWKKGIKWTTWGPVSLMYGPSDTEVEDMVVLSYRAVPPLAPRADFAPLSSEHGLLMEGLELVERNDDLLNRALTSDNSGTFHDWYYVRVDGRNPDGSSGSVFGGWHSTLSKPDTVVLGRAGPRHRALRPFVAEVVSRANRRQADYETAVLTRATDYAISWVLIVDPESRTARWWHNGTETADGPDWAASVDTGAIWPN